LRPLKFFVSASFENNGYWGRAAFPLRPTHQNLILFCCENGIREIALDILIAINATK